MRSHKALCSECVYQNKYIKMFSRLSPSAVIGQWQVEPKERLISLVLTHLPLLKPGNGEAKSEYMRLLPKILTHTIEFGRHLEESRQLLSYALIHPATSLEDRADLALWLNHLEERAATRTAGGGGGGGDSLERVPSSHHLYAQHQRYGSDDRLNGWQGSRDSGIATWHTQQQQQGCENGHLLLYPSSSVPATINTVGTGSGSNSSEWIYINIGSASDLLQSYLESGQCVSAESDQRVHLIYTRSVTH